MSSSIGELTGRAHQLVAAGDLAAAQELLADALADADPRPANASPELADAASLQARVLVALGEPHSARGWAAFAHAAATRLHGPSDQRTVAAAATLAAVLHRVGSHARAARLYQDVIIELTALDGPESLRVLAAHADLATVEYARGECSVARERLQDAWELHREVYGDGHPSGIKMLARLGAMQRDCGHFSDAYDNLALARELCRQHLPADDPLAAQVTTLARAAADPQHVCDRDDETTGPVVPGARTPSADEEETDWPPDWTDQPDVDWSPRQVDEPRDGRQPGQESDGAFPVGDSGRPAAQEGEPTAGAQAAGYGTVPRPRTPLVDGDDTTGRSYAHDQRYADPDRYDDTPAGDHWWPPEEHVDSPDKPVDPEQTGAAVPPSVVGLTAGPYPQESPGVHRVGPPPVPADPDRHLPVPRGSRLPVHVPRPPAQPSRRLAPLVVAGVVVVLLGTGAVIAGVARVNGTSGAAPGTGVDPTPDGAGQNAVAPGGVTLRDNRENVTLTWTYPSGATGPVVVSGGPVGEDPRPYQELPAGADNYIVYGLDQGSDYCFTVAIVHSAQTVAAAKPVCTKRT